MRFTFIGVIGNQNMRNDVIAAKKTLFIDLVGLI
jgi:hypothetical protein